MKFIELHIVCILCVIIVVLVNATQIGGAVVIFNQSYSDMINALLKELVVKKEGKSPNEVLLIPPDIKIQEKVQSKLLDIANQSGEARSAVVQILLSIVDDQSTREETINTRRWILAVNLLAELQAVEAIDVLIKNLDEPGMILDITPNVRPARSALIKIGKSAIPSLIEALGHQKNSIRWEAILALTGIGQIAVPQLIEALSNPSPSIRGGVALALGWIGGQKPTDAIIRAQKIEGDPRAKVDFEYALKQIRKP